MLVYATSADYAAWTGTSAPAGLTSKLRSASLAVREATELDFFATDTTGLPTDAAILQAFNDATCCQAAALVALALDPNAGGAVTPSVKESKSIGTARITYAQADAANAAAAKAQAATGLVPDALRILRDAGLARTAPWVVG
jgi:hypothetical protein